MHYRDPLLRTKQQPIFQAILQHLPIDGLEKYDDRVVEIVLEECLRGLEEYPLPPSPSLPLSPSRRKRERVPAWFTATTAPTDWQVLKRLRQLRQVKDKGFGESSSHNGFTSSAVEIEPVNGTQAREPISPPKIVFRSTTATPRAVPAISVDGEERSSVETPDATPCSTPESVAAFASKIKPVPDQEFASSVLQKLVNSKNLKAVLLACLLVFLAVILGYWGMSTASTERRHSAERPAVLMDNSSVPNSLPRVKKKNESVSSNQKNFDFSERNANVGMSLQEYVDQGILARGIKKAEGAYLPPAADIAFTSDDYSASPKSNLGLNHNANPVSESEKPFSTEHRTLTSKSIDSNLEVHEDNEVISTPPFAYSFSSNFTTDTDQVDWRAVAPEPSAVPTRHLDGQDRNQSLVRLNAQREKLAKHLGHFVQFILNSTQTHLQARDEARHILDTVRSQSVVSVNRASLESQVAMAGALEESRKRAESLGKSIQLQQEAAVRFTLEATRLRLEASLVARDHAHQAASTVLGASKNMTFFGLEHGYGVLLFTTNSTLNALGRGVRVVKRHGECASTFVVNAMIQTQSGVTMGLHDIANGSLTGLQVIDRRSRHVTGQLATSTKMALSFIDTRTRETINRVGSIVQSLGAGKFVEVGIGALDAGRGRSLASGTPLGLAQVPQDPSNVKNVTVGTITGRRAAKHGPKLIGSLLRRSGELTRPTGRAGIRLLGRGSHSSLKAISHSSDSASTVAAPAAKRWLQIVDQSSKHCIRSIGLTTERSYDLALLSTNKTLNTVGLGAKLAGAVVHRGIAAVRNCGERSLVRNSRLCKVGAQRSLSASRHRAVRFLSALSHGGHSSVKMVARSSKKTLRVLENLSESARSFISWSSKRTYNTALSATNSTLNGIGVGAGTVRRATHQGAYYVQKRTGIVVRSSLGTITKGSLVLGEGAQQGFAATKKGISVATIEGANVAGKGIKRGFKIVGKRSKAFSDSALGISEMSTQFIGHGVEHALHIATLSTNSTLNIVGRGTIVVAGATKRSLGVIRQVCGKSARETVKFAGKASRLLANKTQRSLAAAGRGTNIATKAVTAIARQGASKVICGAKANANAMRNGSRKRCALVSTAAAESIAAVGIARRNASWLFSRGHHSLECVVPNVAQFATKSRTLSLRGLTRAGSYSSHAVKLLLKSTSAGKAVVRSRTTGLANAVAAVTTALFDRLGVVGFSLLLKLKYWTARVSHVGLHCISVIGAAAMAAFLYVGAELLIIKRTALVGSRQGLVLAGSILTDAKSAAAPALAGTTSVVMGTSPALFHRRAPLPTRRPDTNEATRRLHKRSKSRRVRGAADFAREALRRENNYTFPDPGLDLSLTGKRLTKSTKSLPANYIHRATLLRLEARAEASEVLRRSAEQAMDVILGGLTQCVLVMEMVTQRSLLTVNQRVQASIGRTKELARICILSITAVGEAASNLFDNMALHVQHALSVAGKSFKERRSFILLAQEVGQIIALWKVRELALVVAYNLLIVMFAFMEVGKNELHRVSERQMAAVLQVNNEAWKLIHNAADLRLEGMNSARRTILDSFAKTKEAILVRFRNKGDIVKDGSSALSRLMPFHKRLAAHRE